MNEVQLGKALKALCDERGLSEWELSHQSNVKIEMVAAALRGSGNVPLNAWRRLANALNVELSLSPRSEPILEVGVVETVVDRALRCLKERESPRRQFSLSDLASTPARTDDEIRQAIAQGRVAELKPDQA